METNSLEERAAERYENPQEPYCFETDREQQWYRCGECDGYIAGATDQDIIARQEERERCIKAIRSVPCALCLNNDDPDRCKATNCLTKGIIEAIEEGGEG